LIAEFVLDLVLFLQMFKDVCERRLLALPLQLVPVFLDGDEFRFTLAKLLLDLSIFRLQRRIHFNEKIVKNASIVLV